MARTTIEEAARLHRLIDRPNLFVKILATEPGLAATIARGIPVNVTLIFSLERHRAVANAYIRGLQFADSFAELIEHVGAKRDALVAT